MQSTADHTHQKYWDRSHLNPTTLVGYHCHLKYGDPRYFLYSSPDGHKTKVYTYGQEYDTQLTATL